ncbi:MAG: hypothetical protein ACOX7P_00605 [Oscillospiraceae bacterium]|jgi:rRNA maturation endonuclease Nob1
MGTVKSCELCGRLFQSYGTRICAKCSEEADRAFRTARDFINSSDGSVGLNDILENTDVSEKIALYLIKEGRLSQKFVNIQGRLRCAACGKAIETGRLCAKCSSTWKAQSKNETAVSKTGGSKARVMHTYNPGGDM